MPASHPKGQELELLVDPDGGNKPFSGNVTMYDCVGAVGAFEAVELADDGNHAGIQLPAAQGNRCIGIALKAGAIGDSVPVCTHGLCPATLGGTITSPDELQADTDGHLIAAATSDVVVASALEDGTDGQVKWVHVQGQAGYTHA